MAAGFYLDGSVQTLMSRRHMNSDFPQGIVMRIGYRVPLSQEDEQENSK